MPDLLQAIGAHLIARGVGRDPRTAGSLPPIWIEPRHAVPEPGHSPASNPTEIGPTAVIGVLYSGGIPPKRTEVTLRKDTVDIVLRVATADLFLPLERQIRQALIGLTPADTLAWNMAGLTILESAMWRPFAPVENTPLALTYSGEFLFETNA